MVTIFYTNHTFQTLFPKYRKRGNNQIRAKFFIVFFQCNISKKYSKDIKLDDNLQSKLNMEIFAYKSYINLNIAVCMFVLLFLRIEWNVQGVCDAALCPHFAAHGIRFIGYILRVSIFGMLTRIINCKKQLHLNYFMHFSFHFSEVRIE